MDEEFEYTEEPAVNAHVDEEGVTQHATETLLCERAPSDAGSESEQLYVICPESQDGETSDTRLSLNPVRTAFAFVNVPVDESPLAVESPAHTVNVSTYKSPPPLDSPALKLVEVPGSPFVMTDPPQEIHREVKLTLQRKKNHRLVASWNECGLGKLCGGRRRSKQE